MIATVIRWSLKNRLLVLLAGSAAVNAEMSPILASRTVNQKRLPWPGSLSTPVLPPIMSTRRRVMARPRPVPPYLRVVDPSA